MNYEAKKHFIIDVLYIATVVAVIYFVVKYLLFWTLPFCLGFLIVLMLQPLTKVITRKTAIKNKTAMCFVIAGFYGVIVALIWLMGFAAIGQISKFIATWPQLYSSTILPALENFNEWLTALISRLSPEMAGELSNTLALISSDLSSLIAQFSTGFISMVSTRATQIPMFLIALLFTIICSVFISLNFQSVTEFLLRQLPTKGRDVVDELNRFLSVKVSKVLKAYLLIMCITFTELSIGLSILQVDFSLVIAGIIAIFDILPFLGSGGILLPWALIKMIVGDMQMAAGLFILYVVILIVRNIIEPKIVGGQIGLHPIVTITAMYAGLKIMGFIGFILGPITVLFLIHLNDTGYIQLWKNRESEGDEKLIVEKSVGAKWNEEKSSGKKREKG